jgi:pectinesterase
MRTPSFLHIIASLATLSSQLHAQSAPTASPASTTDNFPKWKKLVATENPPDNLRLSRHVVAAYPEHTVELIVYTPKAPGLYPAVLDVHGGGWSQRQIESDRVMMERLALRGFVTALVSYRISSEAPYPAALSDCKAAVRFLRAHATTLGLNPEHIGVMGGSAGGHLSALTALTSGKKEFEGDGPLPEKDSTVQACIVMAASQDLFEVNKSKTNTSALAFFGTTCEENPDLYRQASPINHIRAGVPPTLFIEGEKDTLKVGRKEAMEKLQSLGIDTALHTLKGAPHPFWMSDPWCAETVEIAAHFFGKHLGGVEPLIPD